MSRPPRKPARTPSGRDRPDLAKIPAGDRLRALTVGEIMTREVFTAQPRWSLLQATQTMREKHVSGLPVVEEGDRVIGILSERDVLADLDRAVGVGSVRGFLDLLLELEAVTTINRLDQCLRRLENARVADAMSSRVVSVDPDASVGEAARRLRTFGVKRLPVVDEGHLVGIVTRQNIVDALS